MIHPSNFAGRTALVTGGASGLGRAMAEALAANGASLVIFDLNHAPAKQLAADLEPNTRFEPKPLRVR
jgi:NAD(P)-dependent dehydrogenase (short-subunit alcohol dehydrogenase family)